ncbi:MAG TPA: hypothetical protein VFO03_07105 [Gaiellaceae bacterium]|nr:hypothetical protein [Gaiellaceae bacterium]
MLNGLAVRADEMAGAGRTAVHVAVDARPAGLIAANVRVVLVCGPRAEPRRR